MGVGSRGLAVGVAYALGALATYTAYFMPDSLFAAVYLTACVALAVALGTMSRPASAIAGIAGAILPSLKPHGLVVTGVLFLLALIVAAHGRLTAPASAQRSLLTMLAAGALTT